MRRGRLILGVDPGVASTGVAVVTEKDGRYASVAYDCIRTSPKDPFPDRLALLHGECRRLVDLHRPDALAMERLFFARNARTAIAVGQAQGALLLAVAGTKIEVFMYTPMEVKMAVTGDGRAEKSEVALMIQKILGLDCIPRPDDASDALAIAYCHLVSTRMCGRT